MRKGTIVKTVFVTGSLCAALWQAAQFMEILSSARGQRGGSKPLSAMNGLNGQGLPPEAAEALKKQAGLLGQLGVGSAGTPAEAKEIVVFAPGGKKMTPAELEALKRAAERNRPKIPAVKPK